MSKEIIFQRPALTQGWENLKPGELYFFDTVNKYAKKYHLDLSKDGPIGRDEPSIVYEVEDILGCIGDDTIATILTRGPDKLLVLLTKELPYLLIQGKDQKRISLEDHGKEGIYGIKKLYPDYQLEAVVINPRMKTLEKLGVLKSIIKQAVKAKDFLKGGVDVAKETGQDQAGPERQEPPTGGQTPDSNPCE
jgi:hypothetical protein